MPEDKMTQAEVDYKPSTMEDDECRYCVHFLQGDGDLDALGTCTLVAGKIAPEGWCKLWEEEDEGFDEEEEEEDEIEEEDEDE